VLTSGGASYRGFVKFRYVVSSFPAKKTMSMAPCSLEPSYMHDGTAGKVHLSPFRFELIFGCPAIFRPVWSFAFVGSLARPN